MHSVVSVCVCVYPGLCFTIVDVGGQQVENSLWVAGTIQLAEACSLNLVWMHFLAMSLLNNGFKKCIVPKGYFLFFLMVYELQFDSNIKKES